MFLEDLSISANKDASTNMTPSVRRGPVFVGPAGGCWAVLQQEGLGAQLHIRHQDHRPRLLPGSRLRGRDEQVGPLHL